MARKKEAGSTSLSAPLPTLIIQPKDFVQLIANEVTLDELADNNTLEEGM